MKTTSVIIGSAYIGFILYVGYELCSTVVKYGINMFWQ